MDKNYTSTTSSTTSRKKKKIKCSFCEQNEASIILTDTSKPLCLLHYYTTRSCRSNNLIHNNNNNKKIRIIGNEAEFEQQKINVQLLFAQAFDELRREIAEEVVKPSTAAAFRPMVNGKGAAPQQQQQKLDEKDPLSVLFDAPRRKKPQKELLQRQQQLQQRMQRQQQQPVAMMDRKPMRKMNKPTKTNDVSNFPISNVMGAQRRRSPSPSPPSQSKRHSIPNTTMPKRRSFTPSPPPLTNPPPPPKRQQRPQWQKIPQPSKQEESIENEGGFLRTATLPTKIIQHQKRQQEEIAKEERFITSKLYKNENDKNDEINIALQRQQRQNNNRGTNPYKRRKITSKSIWNLALDDTNTNPTNSNSNQLVNFDNENETILKPSTPCPQCNKIENVIYEGNIMTCRNDDVAKAETWGRKDRSDIVLMKCRCLDCGRVWNEDE